VVPALEAAPCHCLGVAFPPDLSAIFRRNRAFTHLAPPWSEGASFQIAVTAIIISAPK